MKRTIVVLILLLIGLSVPTVALAQDWFLCQRVTAPDGAWNLQCAFYLTPTPVPAATATPVPAATNTPIPPTATSVPLPTATPVPDMTDTMWHAPATHGDRPFHEHGDAVPQWVTAAGYAPMYSHNHGTVGENIAYWKHTGFKGWAGNFNGQDWYGVFHLDVNPGGQGGRYHSYQLWIKDPTLAVSHFSGWLDFNNGNATGAQKIVVCGTDSGVRPIIMVNAAAPCTAAIFENWYARAGGSGVHGPDVGFNIAPNYRDGGDPLNPATWQSINGFPNNLTRRIEFAWYSGRSNVRGSFWADQFGRIAPGGPNSPECAGTRTVGDRTYTIQCALQVIQPSLLTIQFPGNAVQRTFGGAGVVLPN